MFPRNVLDKINFFKNLVSFRSAGNQSVLRRYKFPLDIFGKVFKCRQGLWLISNYWWLRSKLESDKVAACYGKKIVNGYYPDFLSRLLREFIPFFLVIPLDAGHKLTSSFYVRSIYVLCPGGYTKLRNFVIADLLRNCSLRTSDDC